MDEGSMDDALAFSLLQVASDPAQLERLYLILRGFCHHCRNNLSSLKLGLYIARRSESPAEPKSWDELEHQCRMLELAFDRLQTFCRPINLAPVCLPFCALVKEKLSAWQEHFAAHGRSLELIRPSHAFEVRFDPSRLGHALDAIVEWRARAGQPGQPACLSWQAIDNHVLVHWHEPCVAPQPEIEGEMETWPGALSLPLLARVAAAHGGTLDYSVQDGLHIRLRWPL
jgi:hypothetical protein